MSYLTTPPLSLYIHIPWCIKKCPYCDFNSHAVKDGIPESQYITRLIQDLENDIPYIKERSLHSIFIGGGTPSLFSAAGFERLLNAIFKRLRCETNLEITLEANPGTAEHGHFADLLQAGINRLSLGVQSFHDEQLQFLGRIHGSDEARHAIDMAQKAGFQRLNIDLMHSLPGQTSEQALKDLKLAHSMNPTHISWYQLSLEPNTVFAKYPPQLPDEDTCALIQQAGHEYLIEQNWQQYETSAYCQDQNYCRHNVNYWQFGDYIGIGAGAHGKITDSQQQQILRTVKYKQPERYLSEDTNWRSSITPVPARELPFEFMLNALRLTDGVPQLWFNERTGLSIERINHAIELGQQQGLLTQSTERLQTTELGQQFLNNCLTLFMADQ